ncbi:MAG: peptidylprolyl isomerase [Flavobacteriaceae bacterium]|nr:peptidylprolyl isomerase [Flavobacteriaceae bacterium]
MAILSNIRKRGIFLIIIIALALFAFIVSDSLTKGGGGQDVQDTVASINGIDLSRSDFMGDVEAYQRSLGPNATTAQAMGVIWQRKLRSTLMQEQVDALGMTISQEQLAETLSIALANNPTFQDVNGFYSEARVNEYIQQIKGNPKALKEWNNYMQNTKESILQNHYLSMVRGGLVTTSAEGEQQYRFENDKINIDFVFIPYTKIADEGVEVTETEIAAYIKANPDKFEVDPSVDLEYVSYLEEPSIEDIDEARLDMEDMVAKFKTSEENEVYVNEKSDNSYVDRWYFKNNLPPSLTDTILNVAEGDVYGPYKVGLTYSITKVIGIKQLADSVKSRHILIPIGLNRTDSITRTKEQAKVTADSLLRIIKSNKSKFEGFVTDFSSDSGSIENGGRYDWYPYNKMVAPFRDFTFEGSVGSIGVVETQFGYHIIEIEGQKNEQKLVKLATVSREIEASEKTLSDVFSKAAKFEEAAREGDYTAVALENALTPKPVNKIGNLDANIPGIGNDRSIINWAFEEDTKVGAVKRMNVNDTYVIVRLTRKNAEKALMSVAEASGVVTPILRKEKKAKKIHETISGTTLQEIATSQNVTVKNATALTRSAPTIAGAGTEPVVVGAAFGKKVGEMTNLIDGETGVFMVQVLAINNAPDLENYGNYVTQLKLGATGAINNSVYQALKKAADIEDNRASFY